MKKIFIIHLLFASLVLVSCEDFFDLKPHSSTEESEILKDEDDAQTLLYGMYSTFKSGSSYGKTLTVLTDIMTDATLATSDFSNQMGNMYAWNIQPGIGEIGGLWGNHYSGIYLTNKIINNIDGIEGEKANLERIKGEALVGRALFHYNLVKFFAKAYDLNTAATDLGVPYMTENVISQPTRDAVSTVYAAIKSDLEAAVELLPNNPQSDTEFFTRHFANGLLARISLDMRDYDGAINYSEDVINNSGCRLLGGNAFINMWTHDSGNEIIWKVGYTDTDKGDAPGYNFLNRNYETSLPYPDYIPANWLLNLYNQVTDIRFYTYFKESATAFGWSGYLVNKFPYNPELPPFRAGLNMPKPMRLAEMYLIRAEAYAMKDMDKDAAIALNSLLDYRLYPNPGVIEKGDDLKELIAEERIKELIYEGFYYHDLKRSGLGFERVPQENTSAANDLRIATGDFRWIWPIPTSELNGNSEIEQNEGYEN
ncbi:RagB/SusD family nutrient uptake outer membrane protein [Carboxylicivirga sp. M1479]|uniref:RagB/SusD family nutrient uptake outer membrane protein n=1 Tax=Carboxylicivirga sp. M1479 TaxID=2594476 RepID=UPI0011778EA6|nr:RagB/SusD family nutrient uptake outer membrane protein [Carboxylicivirga sp. M1479]TRX72090.1 RagB/SusD family nutrient uptake outer membrane protein [Carboxylicivirga sp. M1479]